MEPETLLPCSQKTTIEPYSERVEFSPHYRTVFLEDDSSIIRPSALSPPSGGLFP